MALPLLLLGFLPELDRWTAAGLMFIGAGLIFAMTVVALDRR